MKKLLVFALFFSYLLSFGQGDQTIISIPGVEPAILHLPASTSKLPLLVFLHGKGEGGTNPATIYTSTSAGGPAYFIAQKLFAASMIVVSPQYPSTTTGTSAAQLDLILQYLVKTYPVDVTRIYLTGLSEGAAAVCDYISGTNCKPSYKIAAAIPMSAAIGQPTQAYINAIAATGIHVWGFGSMSDIFGIQTRILIGGAFNGNGGTLTGLGALGKFTDFTSLGGHCCWNTFYNPTYTEGGMNIYQWLLQYSAGVPTVTPIPITTTPPCPIVDSISIGKAYMAAHPCPVCPVADSAGIIKFYIAGHPCPICPPRATVKSIVSDVVAGISTFIYTDGFVQTLAK